MKVENKITFTSLWEVNRENQFYVKSEIETKREDKWEKG